MQIIVNNWRLEPSLNGLVHSETAEVQRLGEFHFVLLETLATHAGEVLSRSFLINEVWKNRVVGNNSLPTAIYALRVALGDDGRQQEIIKTIPKKGYVLSKNFIVVINDDTPTLADTQILLDSKSDSINSELYDEQLPLQERDTSLSKAEGILHDPLLSNSTIHSGSKKRPFKKIKLLTSLLALLLIATFSGLFFHYNTAKNGTSTETIQSEHGLVLLQEDSPDNERMKIFHLRRSNIDKKNTLLAISVRRVLYNINQLLITRNATMSAYYYVSIPKLSIDISLKDSCKKEFQLSMNINNWQSDGDELSSLIFQEVERTLNEMPACK